MPRLATLDDDSEPVIERMWVTFCSRDGDVYHGHLANTPHTRSRAQEGMAVWFRAEHVIDYYGDPGELRSDAWCDECHREFIKTNDWETAAKEPTIEIVCGGCYDKLKARHSRDA